MDLFDDDEIESTNSRELSRQEEREFINKLWRTLGMSGDDAKTIVQVMVIKNKG
jgi:hypothetical protein